MFVYYFSRDEVLKIIQKAKLGEKIKVEGTKSKVDNFNFECQRHNATAKGNGRNLPTTKLLHIKL